MSLENLHLGYRIKRFFAGESGIVEKVEELPKIDENGREIWYNQDGNEVYYWCDSKGDRPTKVIFRNSLGELITRFAPIQLIPKYPIVRDLINDCDKVYKQYKSGDKFP